MHWLLTCCRIRHTGKLSKVEGRAATTAGPALSTGHQTAAGQAGRCSTAFTIRTAQNGLLKALVELKILEEMKKMSF